MLNEDFRVNKIEVSLGVRLMITNALGYFLKLVFKLVKSVTFLTASTRG